MVKKIVQYAASYRLMSLLLFIYVVAIAVATFVESFVDTATARSAIYNAWWFIMLQGVMVVNFIAIAQRRALWGQRKWGALMLHYGMVVTLLGALTTYLFSYEGVLRVREGESSNQLHTTDGVVVLPFRVHLRDFELTRYPGSSSPSSFRSDVLIEHKGETKPYDIYMNNIAYVGSYRVYQTSYDKDELGTILTVNHDLLGTIITYIGYLMLGFGMVWSLLHRGARFSALRRRLGEIAAVVVLGGVLLPSQSFGAEQLPAALSASVIDEELAREFSHLLVQTPEGRIEPLHTYALKIMRKITKSSHFMGLNAEQFLLAMVADPPRWGYANIMSVGNEELLSKIGSQSDEYVAYSNLFDAEGGYKLQSEVERVYAKSAKERNGYEKELLKLDEKANILNAIFQLSMLPLFPVAGDEEGLWVSMGDDLSVLSDSRDSLFVTNVLPWFIAEATSFGGAAKSREVIEMIRIYQNAKADADHLISDRKIEYEVFYNRANIFKRAGLSYLAAGSIMLILLLIMLLRGGDKGGDRWLRRAVVALSVVLVAAFVAQTFGIGLRWYISGRAPWTNSYESMIYVGWSALLVGVMFMRRSSVSLAIAALMAGAVIMISQLNLMDPQITPLAPVLKSYWLMFHVATITASYGFFGVAALIGFSVMVVYAFGGGERLRLRIEELTIINEMAITMGLVLLTVGIFLGAVWANESWGRYWGWDPKESWALITMLVYAFVLHARFMPRMRSFFTFNLMAIYSFYTVLMTFFGVNYYLVGMHSYGHTDGIAPLAVVLPTTMVVAVSVVAYMRRKQ